MKANGGKIAIVVALLAVAVGVYFFTAGDTSPSRALPNSIPYVCVETGEIFHIRREGTRVLPLENPKTKRHTLVPVYEQDGEYYVSERRAHAVREAGDLNKVVDLETLKVKRP